MNTHHYYHTINVQPETGSIACWSLFGANSDTLEIDRVQEDTV
jgi:hypothetical protein